MLNRDRQTQSTDQQKNICYPNSIHSIPTLQLCRIIRSLLWNATDIPEELYKDFKLFEQISRDLFKAIDIEEKQRPKFIFNASLHEKASQLKIKIMEEKKSYENRIILYEKSFAALNDKLTQIHQKIAFIKSRYLDNKKLLINLKEEVKQLHEESKTENGCTSYIFSCFMLNYNKNIKKKILDIENQFNDFKSDNTDELIEALTTVLTVKYELIEMKKTRIIHNQPKKVHDDLLNELTNTQSSIQNNVSKHYTAVSNEAMYHTIRAYEIYTHLADGLVNLDLNEIALHNVATAHTLAKLKILFIESRNYIENLIINLWCPHSNNHDMQYFYEQFLNLPDAIQYKIMSDLIFSADEIEHLIPFQEVDNAEIDYHPIGICKRIPSNCKAFKMSSL